MAHVFSSSCNKLVWHGSSSLQLLFACMKRNYRPSAFHIEDTISLVWMLIVDICGNIFGIFIKSLLCSCLVTLNLMLYVFHYAHCFVFTLHFFACVCLEIMMKAVCGHWYYYCSQNKMCSKEAATALVLFCVYFVDFSLPKISCLASEMPTRFCICLANNLDCVGFEVLTVVIMKGTVFWHVTACGPLEVSRRCGGIYHLHL